MAPQFSLQLKDIQYSAEQLRQPKGLKSFTDPGPEGIILRFCSEWLAGKESFTVHTSGSTGKPKPILLSRRQMIASARQTIKALGLKEGANALLCINPAYIGGKMMLVRAMEHNMALTVLEAEANPLLKLPTDSSIDFTALVPLQLESILQQNHSRAVLKKMKAVIVGGAPVSWKLRQQLQDINAPVYSTYGMTETVSHIALLHLNSGENSPYFQAFPEIRLSLDERGCLIIEGEVTDGVKIVTNDVVELADANKFRWIGRADNIINSGGVKIHPEKIENIIDNYLKETGQSRKIFAWGIPDEKLGQKLVLFAEGEPLSVEAEKQIRDLLALKLAKYEQPKSIFYLPEFRLTPSGKIQKADTATLFGKT